MVFMLRHKALLPVLLLAAMSAVYVSFSLYALYTQHRTTEELAGRVHEIQQLSNLILRTQDLARPLLSHAASRGTGAATTYQAISTEIDALLVTLGEVHAVNSTESRLLDQTRTQLKTVHRLAREILALAPAQRTEQLQILEQLVSVQLQELRQQLLAWHQDELQQTDAIHATTRARLITLLVITGALSLLAFLLMLATLWYYDRILVKPLLTIGQSTAILASGNLKHRVPLSTRDEIGQLAGNINRMAGALHSLTERLSQAAETDALTGLLNRRAFSSIVENELALAAESGWPCSLALLDIDHFKVVNDTHGHAMGDAVLRHIARICLDTIRHGDYCFRYGGEELVILMPSTTLAQAQLTLERTRETIAATPLQADGKTITVTVSYGVATSPEDGSQREHLVQHADDALYRAKETGRNRGVAFRNLYAG